MNLSPTDARVPIGDVVIRGEKYDVMINRSWYEYLRTGMFDRVGGSVALTNADLESLIDGVRKLPRPVFFGETDEPETWPGAPGAIGPQGDRGLMTMSEPGEPGEPGWPCSSLPGFRVPLNATSSRALNTTYTNVSTSLLSVHLTVRCAVTLAGGNAYVQAKMDTATPPTVIATGLVGIQAGLLGEDNSFQVAFWVNPGGTYRVDSSATNGTVTLGNWFELAI